MHNVFTDKRRRHLNLREPQVQGVLPEHFVTAYPKFIKLLEEYYEWQGQYESTELLNHLFASRDINETDVTLLSFIEDELLLGENYFEGFGQSEAEKRAAANFSSTLFRAKGSKFAIEWFFRSFYGLDAEVLYPKEDIFNVSDNDSRIGPDYLNYLTDDKLYQTYALLIRVGIPISQWSEVFKKFVHPAGMYLGSEVLLSSNNISNIILDDDSAGSIQRTAMSYSITNDGPTDEGQATTFQIIGNNVPEGTGVVYAYVTHGSTTDSDFPLNALTIPAHGPNNRYPAISSKIPLLNDSAGPALININDDSATFSIRSWIDSDGGASSDNYTLNIIDHEGRSLDSTLITINNVEPSYSLVADPSSPLEGDVITWTVTGTNTPYDGETTLFYHVVHGDTNDSDFSVPPQQDADLQSGAALVTLSGGIGSFTLKTIIDGASDSDEEFTVNIRDSKKLQVASTTVSVTQVASDFTISADDIVEGASLVLNITVNPAEIGDSLTYVITNGDSRIAPLTDTFVVPSEGGGTFVKVIPTEVSDLYQGTVTPTVTVTNNVTNISVQTTFDLTDVTPVWGMTSDPEFAVEGNTITFSVDGTNIPDPSTVWFEILHGTTTNADFTVTPPQTGTRSSTVINDPGDTVKQLTIASDSEVGDETFTARLYDAETGGNLLASIPYVIQGTNTSYALSPSVSSVNEGGQVTFTFTTNQADGTYYWYIPTYSGYTIQEADFAGTIGTNTNRGSFVVTSGTGTIVVDLVNDSLTEGAEAFNVLVALSPNGSVPPVVSSGTVTVNDTSATTFTLTLNPANHGQSTSITEGATAFLLINADTNQPNLQTNYVEITGSGVVGRFPVQQKNVTNGQYPNSLSFATTNSNTYQGSQVVTAKLSTGNYASLGGTVLDTLTFNLLDQAPAMTLTPNATTGDEGDTITYTVSGTNIQDGTYYWYDPALVKTVDVPFGLGSGTSQINHQGSQVDVEIGMSTDDANIPGTVTGVFADYLTMSDPTTRATVTGEHIKFAFPDNFADATEIYGTVAVSSNSGTFELDTLENSDYADDVYTMRVFDNEFQYNFSGTNLGLATAATVTIADTNPIVVQIAETYISGSDTGQDYSWGRENANPAIAMYLFNNGMFGYQGVSSNDSYISPPEARGPDDGKDYQMLVRVYTDSARTTLYTPGASVGTMGATMTGGIHYDPSTNPSYDGITWTNASNQWFKLGEQPSNNNSFTRFDFAGEVSSLSTKTANLYVTTVIKEYTGTLGTGTTLHTNNTLELFLTGRVETR